MDSGSLQPTPENTTDVEGTRTAQSELKGSLDQLKLLLDIGKSIGSELELRELIGVIGDCLREVIHCDTFWMSLVDSEFKQLRVFALDPKFDKNARSTEGRVFPLEGTMAERVINSLETLLVTRSDLENSNSPVVQSIAAQGIRSSCLAPLIARGRPIGVIAMASLRDNAFNQQDAELLLLIAGQIAIAVENALNFERARAAEDQAKRESARAQLLLDINNAVASHLDLQALMQAVLSCLRKVFPYEVVGLAIYDAEINQLRSYANVLPDIPVFLEEGEPIPLEGTIPGLVFTTGQPFLLDRFDDPRFASRFSKKFFDAGFKSGGSVPLISHGRTLGALGVGAKSETHLSKDEVDLLCQVAHQLAIAVENAFNYERARKAEQEVNRKLERERLMLEINNAVVSKLDLQELLQVICSSIREATGYDIVDVSLFDEESGQLRAFVTNFPPEHPLGKIGSSIPLEGGPSGLAFSSGKPVFLEKHDFNRFPSDLSRQVFEEGYRSGSTLPLIAHGRKLGVLGIISKQENSFPEDEKEFLVQLANQAAIAVDNSLNFERARAAEQQMARERERLALLLEINNKIASTLDLRELYKAISACLRAVLHHDYADLALYDAQTDRMLVYAVDRSDRIHFGEEEAWASLDGSPPGLAIHFRQTVLRQRPDFDEFPSEGFRRAVSEGIRSGCSVPLISRDRVIGVMNVASGREAAFTSDDAELLTDVGAQVAIALENALAFKEIETLKNKVTSEKLYLEAEIRTEHNFEELIGSSPSFKRILGEVETVAPTDSAVLIRGETGTGKELIARAIHNLSTRRERTLVKLNCAAIPTGLLESELFGHEKGAFTGAISQRIGRFELANKATLLLDEVGDIPLELQPKLLRVLQEQEFERLGSTRTQKVDVRLIAATNNDLQQMVAEKKYRSDLYFRLNVFPITIPPLRERRTDIPPLARFFAQKYAQRMKKRIESISSEAMGAMTEYSWPGNVRELEHFIERAVVLTRGAELEVSLSELKPVGSGSQANVSTLEAAERDHILRALEETNWVVGGANGAAARLGMKRTTLQSRMQKLGLERGK